MLKKKYDVEKGKARYVATHKNLLPYEIKHDEPTKLAVAIRKFLRKENHNEIGVSEDSRSIWLWRYKN